MIDHHAAVVARVSVNFDDELPHYNTRSGMHRVPEEGGERVTSPVFMWLEAVDILLTRLGAAVPLQRVAALSASAQQHSSIYWKAGAQESLQALGKDASHGCLKDALQGCFAVADCPIWADSSTFQECEALEKAMGGPTVLAELTGSRAFPRFTAQQIARIARRHPGVWEACERVSLVSSFLSSILIADFAPIDASDGSGMNLMDLRSRRWSKAACDATAPGLMSRLGGEPADPSSTLGPICKYFQERYNFTDSCQVVCCSGDNPNALVGLGLQTGEIAVSLGTSDTLMGVMSMPAPKPDGHVMCHAGKPDTFFAMLVYKNADVVRKQVRDTVCDGDWANFSRILAESAPGNGGVCVLGVVSEEITPKIQKLGFHRDGSEDASSSTWSRVARGPTDVRGVVEGRFLSMASRAKDLGITVPPQRVFVTGGASDNIEICQILSDVFRAPVLSDAASGPDSASLGAALRARAAVGAHELGVQNRGRKERVVASPRPDAGAVYDRLLPRFAAFERSLVDQRPD